MESDQIKQMEARIENIEAQLKKIEPKLTLGIILQIISIVIAVLIAFLKFVWLSNSSQLPGANTNSVQIGETTTPIIAPHRDYLDTEEVAKNESVSTRTVQSWIAAGRITPVPERHGRAWHIAANYRILPQTAANSGNPAEKTALFDSP